MLAHSQGTMLNAARLAGGLAISSPTVTRYIDLLVDLLLVRRLQPFHANTGKRLVKSPKVYVRDSGLTHALLGIEDQNELAGVIAELFYGAAKSARPEANRRKVEEVIRAVEVVPITIGSAARCGALKARPWGSRPRQGRH